MITQEQYAAIREIVETYHDALIAAVLGIGQLPDDVKQRIVALDIPPFEYPPYIRDAFNIGMVVAALPDQAVEMSYGDYQQRLRHRLTPLTSSELRAIDYASQSAAEYCRGLGNRVEEATGHILIEADQEQREWFEGEIRTAVAEGKKWRETVNQVRSQIGRATGDWARDLHRIAATEGHNASQQGLGAVYERRYGPDVHVIKIPAPDACHSCKTLFLDKNGKPRIFRLSEIKNNSNVGRRQADWLPTLSAVHPWCQCQVNVLPDGWTVDDDGEIVPE